MVIYYENCNEHPFYKVKKEEIFEDSEVTAISWNTREDKAVVSMKSSQLYMFQIETDQKVQHTLFTIGREYQM